jgi:6-phosphofructokinase
MTMIFEVMGRDGGRRLAGIAGSSDLILMPEIPCSIDIIAARPE